MEFGGGTDYSSRAGTCPMSQTPINTLRFADRLKAAGFPSAQAEALARSLGDELTEQLPAKADFQNPSADFTLADANFIPPKSALDSRIDTLESKIDGRSDTLENKLAGRIDALDVNLGRQIKTLAARVDGQRVAFNLVLVALGVLIALVGVLVAPELGDLVERVSRLLGV